ncbi:MAG TPA: response regulator [Microvirga sp.]|jgi:CheY-like chemotaxis protein|nr:response regulator [Microvirga sp.]
MKDFAELLAAAVGLCWVGIAGFVVWRILPHLDKLLTNPNLNIKIGQMEISVKEATESLRTQVVDLQEKFEALRGRVEGEAKGVVAPMAPAAASGRRCIWVDDEPNNNALLVDKLSSDGFEIEIATSTSDALQRLNDGRFDLVISDMGRREPGKRYVPDAGLDLLKSMQAYGLEIPLVFYTSRPSVERFGSRAIQAGARAITASPLELYRAVNEIITS